MRTNTLSVPEDVIINLLKSLPPKTLIDVFSKTLIGYNTSPREPIRVTITEFFIIKRKSCISQHES